MIPMRQISLVIVALLTFLVGCKENKEPIKNDSTSKVNLNERSDIAVMGYPIEPIATKNVRLTDDFWLPIIQRIQETTIAYAIEKCKEEGRLENFLIAGGKKEGSVHGEMPFDDTDVYKVIEGASNSLITSPNPELSKLLDSLISIVGTGQETDGYLTTWRTIDPGTPPADWVKVNKAERWDYLYMSHELYNSGHLYEAAYTHYKATGKRNFLDIALKNADLVVKTFGTGKSQIGAVPGHQIIETGLIKLYLATGKKAYLDQAKYFLDSRGESHTHELFGAYLQDHVPVTEQDELVGHAVRAVYQYAAMVDVAAIFKDTDYLDASNQLWNNMVEKKMYVTGGIGAIHDGEQFGENYELPNLTAYGETCAAIGSVYWNHRLHSLTGDAKYFDIIERTMYNGLISGISLDGTKFFYPNPLASDGTYKFNKGACTRQSWFDCSCCPTNLIRFLPSMPELIYSQQKDNIFVNLYTGNSASFAIDDTSLELEQKTVYPKNGNVTIEIVPEKELYFTLKLRVPYWLKNQAVPSDLYRYRDQAIHQSPMIVLNGEQLDIQSSDGYWSISRTWRKGDRIQLEMPMSVKQVTSNPMVEENIGKVALEYGPFVYAVESIDNPDSFDNITVSSEDEFQVKWDGTKLGGINILQNENLTAIPYYTWSNRGVNKMKVWLDGETK